MEEDMNFFIVGERPVKFVSVDGENLDVKAYDWKTGEFISAPQYLGRILFSTGDIEAVSQEEFLLQVQHLRETYKPKSE
ncbi:hypothetical protein ccbrp13_31150 [Ktedonobacteria bacterium brp13]|nr:hypothetical protein ccbrp13_31150 [Ktedonobacteria bacterium brp13]